ncbi:hypothetical protein [Bacillus sp. WP8]|nr:hypothetical protein [Bacillus sp. WP8]
MDFVIDLIKCDGVCDVVFVWIEGYLWEFGEIVREFWGGEGGVVCW